MSEVDESSIKQLSLVYQIDLNSTPHRGVTVRGWWLSLGVVAYTSVK